MMKIKKLLLLMIVAVMISSCASSNIYYDKQQLTLTLDNTELNLTTTLLKQRRENFGSLYLTQSLLRLDDNTVLMYQYARTDQLFEFEHITSRSIAIIFEAKHMYKVYSKNHLYAYQLQLQDNQILNLIAHQSYTQKLKLIYGMSTSKFNEILQSLDQNIPQAYYQEVMNIKEVNKINWNRWSLQKVHFVPLVIPLRELGGW